MRRLLALLLFPAGAWASHPLISEDTGVLGQGRWQVESHGDRARDNGTRSTEVAAVLAYGITDRADVQLEQPYVVEGDKGRGDASVSLKWRFFERGGLSMVLKPDLHEGRRWGLNLVAGYQAGRFELLGQLGYLRDEQAVRHASVAALYAVAERLKLALDFARVEEARQAVVGLVYALSEDVDLGLGWMKGLSHAADDDALRAGIKLRF